MNQTIDENPCTLQSNLSHYIPVHQVFPKLCNIWPDSAEGHRDNIPFIISIIFDLMCGTISSTYIYQFYQRIEITHPLYAVLFSGICFSTAVTFATFGTTLLWYTKIISCLTMFYAIDHLQFGCHLMNNISWITIATIRHNLLAKGDNDSMDLRRLRTIALTSKWSAITGIIVIRLILFILFYLGFNTLLFYATFSLLLLIVSGTLFFVISYKTDKMMKEKLDTEQKEKRGNFVADKKQTLERQPNINATKKTPESPKDI